MKTLFLLWALLACSCATHIERPYVKETTTEKDGRIVVREYSADWIGGSKDLKKVQVPLGRQ